MDVEVNAWSILLATLSSMVIGSIWYARPVFGDLWIKLARVDMKKNTGSVTKPIIISFVASLFTAYVLAHTAYLSNFYFQNSFLHDSLTTAFWLWLGFTAARIITHDAFEGRPSRLSLITIGHEFVTIMLMGLIIGLIGV